MDKTVFLIMITCQTITLKTDWPRHRKVDKRKSLYLTSQDGSSSGLSREK